MISLDLGPGEFRGVPIDFVDAPIKLTVTASGGVVAVDFQASCDGHVWASPVGSARVNNETATICLTLPEQTKNLRCLLNNENGQSTHVEIDA